MTLAAMDSMEEVACQGSCRDPGPWDRDTQPMGLSLDPNPLMDVLGTQTAGRRAIALCGL